MRTRNRVLYAISFVTDYALSLLVFGVSRGLAESGADLLAMGIVGFGLSLVSAVGSVVFGRLSDRLGRERLLFCGVALMMISATGCLFARRAAIPFYWLTGVGTGMIWPSIIAWLSERGNGPNTARTVSGALVRFCLSWNLGLICGQLSGGWLFALDPSYLFALVMLLAACDLVLVRAAGRCDRAAVPVEPSAEAEPPPDARSATFARLSWVANLGGAFAVSMVFHLFPDLAVSLGVPAHRHGVMLASMRVVVIVMYVLMHRSNFWRHRFTTALAAQVIAIAGLIALTQARTELGLAAGLLALGVLIGYVYFASLFYSTAGARDDRRGLAGGIHEGTLGLGLAAGSLTGGMAGQVAGTRAPYWLSAAVIALLLLVQLAMVLRHMTVRRTVD